MLDRIKIPSIFAARLEGQGISPGSVLRQAHLPQTLLSQDKITLTTAQLFAIWQAVGELSGDPAIGLKIGSDPHIERYDPVTIAALSARSFREALTQIARYKQLFCSEEVHLTEANDAVTIEFAWPLATASVPALLLDAAFASVMALGQHGTGRALVPKLVQLTRKSKNRMLYETHFGCPIEFSASADALIYSTQALEHIFVTSNPDLLAMLFPSLEAALTQHKGEQTLPEQVKAIQKRRLTLHQSGIQEVAAELNMTARTLQRRLIKEGYRYQILLENVRSETAQEYLLQPLLELEEIAYLLGYEETNSFHRAFQQWTGLPPGKWRMAQQ